MLGLRSSIILHEFASRKFMLTQGVRGSRHSSTIAAMPSKIRSHVVARSNQSNFFRQRRRNLSGVNPMFPEREIPDKHKISEEADFLTRHGEIAPPPNPPPLIACPK